ncbi:MAG: hypothetical protein ACOCP2_00845, partial [Halohasta sp.]
LGRHTTLRFPRRPLFSQRHSSRTDSPRRERLAESRLDLLAFDTRNPPDETGELLARLDTVYWRKLPLDRPPGGGRVGNRLQ